MARILVVEDDPDSRKLLEAWLSWAGHEVLGVSSGLEAMRMLAAGGNGPVVHLAILDIAMPNITGLQVLHHLRGDPTYARLPAIFLSASDLPADRVAARAMGAQFITKPSTRSAVQAAVEAALTPVPHRPRR